MSSSTQDRALGALVGLAVGDAFGTTLEFQDRDSQPLHTEMVGGGVFDLEPGQWTDDTSMAIALAESLVAHPTFNAIDLMQRFVAWAERGDYSCTGTCFDIGVTTQQALRRFKTTGNPFAGSDAPDTAGNGSIMRIAPVALIALSDAVFSCRLAKEQSQVTHAAPTCLDACQLLILILRDLVAGKEGSFRHIDDGGPLHISRQLRWHPRTPW